MYRTRYDINAHGLKDGDTQLIKAATHNAKEMAKICIEWGADINLRNNLGNSALIEAARRGHDDIVKLLLAQKANLEIENNNKNTAIIEAVMCGHKNTLALLMKAGAKIEIDKALIIAKVRGDLEVENYLQKYAHAVKNLAYNLESKFIYHEEAQSNVFGLVVRYDYLSEQCQKIGVENVSNLLKEANSYFTEQNITVLGES